MNFLKGLKQGFFMPFELFHDLIGDYEALGYAAGVFVFVTW